MKLVSLAGVATAAVIAAAGLATPSSAADLRGMKDGFAAPLPHVQTGSAGPCYFRAERGYFVLRSLGKIPQLETLMEYQLKHDPQSLSVLAGFDQGTLDEDQALLEQQAVTVVKQHDLPYDNLGKNLRA